MQLRGRGIARNLDRIVPGETRVAKSLAAVTIERVQAVPTQVRERVGRDIASNLLDGMRRGEQFLTRRRIDTVKARVGGGWRRDSHMDLARTRLPQHRNHFS